MSNQTKNNTSNIVILTHHLIIIILPYDHYELTPDQINQT